MEYEPMFKSKKKRNGGKELKAVDTLIDMTTNTTGDRETLNALARGTDISERVGRQVAMVSLDYRVTGSCTPGTGTDQVQRFLIVVDHQVNGTAPTLQDVLVSASPDSLTNLNNRARFTILVDKSYVINATGEAGSAKFFSGSISLRPLIETFNGGNAGTVADIATNAIFAFAMGTNAPGATAGAVYGNARFRFYDD